jgi:hypothetical protein
MRAKDNVVTKGFSGVKTKRDFGIVSFEKYPPQND